MILVIDGNNIIMRSFHTQQGTLCTKEGKPSGCIYGFLNSLKHYLELFSNVDKIICTWDGGRSKWRKSLYPEYKANRSYNDTPEEKEKFDGLWEQINILHEFLPSLGVYSIRMPETEADDIIAAICRNTEEQKIVVSADKDMLQLIDNTTTIYSPYKEKIISLINFYEETGVTLESYMGYRALVGDKSDNILGISGIGEKTAKNLMNKYGTIDNILSPTPEVAKDIKKSKRTAKIYDPINLRILGRNNKLMNFNYVNYEDILPTVQGVLSTKVQTDSKKVKDFLIEWQFVSLLANYTPFILSFKCLNE